MKQAKEIAIELAGDFLLAFVCVTTVDKFMPVTAASGFLRVSFMVIIGMPIYLAIKRLILQAYRNEIINRANKIHKG